MSSLVAFGECFACHRVFAFNPELVPSVPIDPITHLPPDLAVAAHPELELEVVAARAIRQPVCESCVALTNRRRSAAGQPLIIPMAGAYLELDEEV